MAKINTLKTTECKRCGRKMKNPKAIERGMGETCWRKFLADNNHKLLFRKDIRNE